MDKDLKYDYVELETAEEKKILWRNTFFLAIENSNCSDYITDIFWRSLNFDLIPIVFIFSYLLNKN